VLARALAPAPAAVPALVLAVGLAGCFEDPGTATGPPTIEVEVQALDLLATFAAGGPSVTVLTEVEDQPLRCVPAAALDKDTQLAADQTAQVLHARPESAFELRVGPFGRGARLRVRTFVFSTARNDPELVDPVPSTFRILIDGEEAAALSSAYVRDTVGHEHPFDRFLRTLELPLPRAPGRQLVLRFETTRDGAEVPEGVVPSEPVWWSAEVVQEVEVPRQPVSTARPNLLVLVVDTLSARRMSLHGYERPTTPELVEFASAGTVFDNAVAPSSWTLPSVASLLTGLAPNTHGVLGDSRSYLMDGLQTWPERLREAGIEGAAFVANPLVAVANHFDQGFGSWTQANDEPACDLNERLLAWLDGQPPDRRWFAYVHYMDPHAPYGAPEGLRERFTSDYVERRDFGGFLPNVLQREEVAPLDEAAQRHVGNLYDGEVAYFDRCFGVLRHELQRRGLLERTVVVLTSDHGEELFEHGRLGHGYALHEQMLAVPLMLVGPGLPSGVRHAAPVGTARLAPTLLALAGLPPPPGLLPLPPFGPALDSEPVFASVRTELFGPRRSLVAARDAQGRKVVLVLDESGETPEVAEIQGYDLARDAGGLAPLDRDALLPEEAAAYEALVERALAWYRATAAARPPEPQPVDAALQELIDEAFRQVGYVGR
jgi:arylsulfatase A-like enzyme